MLDKRSRLAAAALALVVTIVFAGCGTNPSPPPTSSPALPNPFTVVARWSAASLGLHFGPHDAAALAIGPDGNLYVTDLRNRVTVISPEGHVIRRWGGLGTGPGQFHFVSDDPSDPLAILAGIAVDSSGLVYVSDSGNARVQVFKPDGCSRPDGCFVRQFGSLGDRPGEFEVPSGLAVDAAGNVYVLDDGRPGVVNKFSPSGHVVWQVGGATSPDADLRTPIDGLSSVDRHGRLVMVNDPGVVFYLDENGHETDAFSVGETGWCDVNVDALGDTFLTSCGPPLFSTATEVFDHTHTLIAEGKSGGEELVRAPRFGDGEIFALGWDGSLLKLKITLPGS